MKEAGDNPSADVLERTKGDVVELLKQHLKPEFLNRIDEIVMFEPLGRKAITEIVDMQLRGVAKLLRPSFSYRLGLLVNKLIRLHRQK